MARELRCEGLKDPVGIDKKGPELSWIPTDETAPQKCWHVTVRNREGLVYDSGIRIGMERKCILPPLLKEHTAYTWELEWELFGGKRRKQESNFTTGVFTPDHFHAEFITGGTLLRKVFYIKEAVRSAVLYYTGLGYVEGYVNGEKVNDRVLFPSYTIYEKTVEYTAEDITDRILEGENVLGIIVAGHWPLDDELRAVDVYSEAFYRGRCTAFAELHVVYGDGRCEFIRTDESWKVSDSPIRCSAVFDGERYDARLEWRDWCSPGFDDSEWNMAVQSRQPLGVLRYSYTTPIRVIDSLQPIKIWKNNDKWMVDFGQNFTGWISLALQEEAGTEITVRHAEVLYPDGNLNVENLRFAKATDRYICRGESDYMEPRFTYHGFRYVEISGVTGKLAVNDISGKRVHSVNPEIAKFSCSKPELEQIYQAMIWTMRSNMHSIPTDCCQRDERQGWMADAGMASEFCVLNFDVLNFYRKWFRDIRDSQEKDGSMPLAGAPGWPRDTFIWKVGYYMTLRSLYLYTGDREVVAENYPSLRKYEEHVHASLINGLLSYDFYNDWLALEYANNLMIANSFLVDFYEALILFAEVLDDAEGKVRYQERLEHLKDAINREYYGRCMDDPLGTGYYGTCDTLAVAPSAMALAFHIVPEKYRAKVIREMLFQITESRGSVQYPTGILTSGILNQCLSDLGFDEIVYAFMEREDYPSLRFMLSKGATTIWERWQYLTHNEMNSHNHPALCSLGSWFLKALCGLRGTTPEKTGGVMLEISPFIPEDMDHAEMELQTVWGRIVLSWKREDDKVRYYLELPGCAKAHVYYGDNLDLRLEGGIHEINL